MAFDAFLKLTDIKGESQDTKYGSGQWIDILSFTYGVTQGGSASSQGGLTAGKANFQDFTFTQKVHIGSPELFIRACNGKTIDEAHFVARKAGGDNPEVFLQIKMKNVLVTSVTTQGAGGPDEIPTETISLTAEMLGVWYGQQNEKNKIIADVGKGWNQKKNALEPSVEPKKP